MKKFIEALKEAGIYDHIVETIVDVRNRYGAKDATKGITMILKTEMIGIHLESKQHLWNSY